MKSIPTKGTNGKIVKVNLSTYFSLELKYQQGFFSAEVVVDGVTYTVDLDECANMYNWQSKEF